ncbi:hypothetical protein CLOM_g4069 [Closterium sp. NIES-68]|nr:hypothetical protein CLOM_g4069 [Closterium sp. NIES-68]
MATAALTPSTSLLRRGTVCALVSPELCIPAVAGNQTNLLSRDPQLRFRFRTSPNKCRLRVSHRSRITRHDRRGHGPTRLIVAQFASSGSGGTGGVEWNAVSRNVLIGTSPRDQAQLEALATRAGVNAVLCLEEGAGRQAEWAGVAERAQEMGMVAVRLPLADANHDEQAMALPRAISAVDLLLSRGYTVHVCCSTGNDKAPLVALGYLTLVHGQSLDAALAALKAARPSIKPYLLPWEKLRDSLSAGDSKRVLQLTQEEFRRRLAGKEPGTHAHDWQVALGRVASDRFRERLAADNALVQQLCQAAAEAAGGTRGGGGGESGDEVKSLKTLLQGANTRAATADAAAAAARDRIDFFFRQVTSLKAREEAARKQARVAERRVEGLLRELEEQRRRVAEEAERRAEERRQEVQDGRVQALTAAEAGELVGRVVELEGLLSQTRAALQAATDRNDFFLRQLSAIRDSEKKSRASARAADRRYFAILRRVEELGRKEASAKQVAEEAQRRYESMATELQGLGSVGDIKERLEELNAKVADLKRKEAQAEAATRAALERVAVLSEQLDEAAAREADIRASERSARERADSLEVRVEALVSDLQAAKEAAATAERSVGEISEEVAKLREREAAADEAIRRYEAVSGQMSALQAKDANTRQEIDAANRRIGLLSEQIVRLTKRETELQEALATANDHISFLSTRVSELIEREEEAKAQAERADTRVAEMHSEVAAVQQREAVALREAEAASRKLALVEESEAAAVEAAMRANARVEELFRQVEDVEQREAAAKAAAKAAYERLAEMSERLAAAEERSQVAAQALERSREMQARGGGDSAAPWDAAVVFDSRTADPVPVRSSPSSSSSVNGTALPPSSFIAQQLSSSSSSAPPSVPQSPQEREEQRRVEEEVEETRRALGATVDECVGLFLGQVAALREREQASKQALGAANQRIEELSTQVALLANREDAANAEAEAFAGQVTGLVMRIADLNEELEAAERREAELADALTAGGSGGGLPGLLKQDPQKLIAELEAARRRADELAAEVEEARRTAEDISESIFNARKKSLQEQQQREELVAEVLSLKEAMEAMRERDEAIAVWKQQLAEQAEYLDSLMAEGQVDQSQRDMLRAAVREIQLGSGDQAFSAV